MNLRAIPVSPLYFDHHFFGFALSSVPSLLRSPMAKSQLLEKVSAVDRFSALQSTLQLYAGPSLVANHRSMDLCRQEIPG
jgi:hypothetical protein